MRIRIRSRIRKYRNWLSRATFTFKVKTGSAPYHVLLDVDSEHDLQLQDFYESDLTPLLSMAERFPALEDIESGKSNIESHGI